MFANSGNELMNPYDIIDNPQAIAYGRSGSTSGNIGMQHSLMWQTNTGNEFAGAWLAVCCLIVY